jgi:hypothetical protein
MMAGPPFSGGGDATADFRVIIRPSSWWTYEEKKQLAADCPADDQESNA